ncbi:MAG: carboxypeptidase-like regulatory domain-containing protein [Bacteroidota bacterium]
MTIRATGFTCWALIFVTSVPSLAQHETFQLRGSVVDSNQVPAPGAAVTVAETNQRAITDESGKSLEQEKREAPIRVDVIDTEKLQVQSLSLPQVINQMAFFARVLDLTTGSDQDRSFISKPIEQF